MSRAFISHSSKDDLSAEALRVHLASRGWHRGDIFLDFNVEGGIAAHERWKAALATANAGADVLICLVSPDWLQSVESRVELRVAETLREIDPRRTRAVILAIIRPVPREELKRCGLDEYQTVNLSAAGTRTQIRAELPARSGDATGRVDDIGLNSEALDKLERSLRLLGVAPESYEWRPRDPNRPSPYPGLEAFEESEAGVFFGREARLAEAVAEIERLARMPGGARILTVIAASGVGKSSFLRAGLWPRLQRRSGVCPLVILRPGGGILTARSGGLLDEMAAWFARHGHSVDPAGVRRLVGASPTRSSLARLLGEAAPLAGAGRTLVLGIDQAEELFDSTDRDRSAEAQRLLEALLALLAAPEGELDLLLVLTIRADSYDPLALVLKRAADAAEQAGAPRAAALSEASFTLAPMPASAYRDIISRPARVARRTERDVFAPALVEHLAATFTGADALPLLAMTLEQLYHQHSAREQITLDDYRALYGADAGAEGPVRRALQQAYRLAGAAGREDTLQRLLVPGLATWDPEAGETGAAKRRVALRATLLAHEPGLEAMADALASPEVRLLTRGHGGQGATLEVSHEALLRVEPVKGWIARFAGELRLRDEIEREAAAWEAAHRAWQAAEAAAGNSGGGGKVADAVAKAYESAIAARRGPRLEAAQALARNPAFARLLSQRESDFIADCQAHETAEIDKQRRIIGRAFVKPALQALEDGLSEHALRLAAAGVLLAKDLGFDARLDTRLWEPAARAIFENRTRTVLKGHSGAVAVAAFSPDGARIVTASSDNTARIWDVSRSATIARSLAIALTAALAQGLGWRTDRERADLLMQDAEDDLFAEALKQLGRAGDDREIGEAAAALRAPLHPNCYLSPTQFAERFSGQRAARGGDRRATNDQVATSLATGAPDGAGSTSGEPGRPAAASAPPPPSASAAAQPRRRLWPFSAGLLAVLLAAGVTAAVAWNRVDLAELAQRLGVLLQR